MQVRRVGMMKRIQPPGDAPPPWLLPCGLVGLAVTIIGRVIDGAIGQTLGDWGCGTAVFAGLVFFGLLAERLSPRQDTDGR